MTTRRVPLTLFARQGITKTGKVVQHVKQVIISLLRVKANASLVEMVILWIRQAPEPHPALHVLREDTQLAP